jgi:hypothetical protein
MVKSNYNELNKFTLVRWMDMALNQSFTKQNIGSCFRDIKNVLLTLSPWMMRLGLQMFVGKKSNEVYMKNNMYQMMELITIYNLKSNLLQHILLI